MAVMKGVLEDVLAELAKDPDVFVGALVPQPGVGGRGAEKEKEGVMGARDAAAWVTASERRVARLEAQMFAEFVLDSAVMR